MRAFIFDLDGTLLNTLADIGSACNAVLARHGYPQHPLPAYARMVGNGFETLIQRALPTDRMPKACALASITQEARAWYGTHMMERTCPYPGMKEALTKLTASDCALAVLSNKPDALSAQLIQHYFPGISFCRIQGAKQDIPLKPDPAALLAILQDMKIAQSDACYVGDSNVDIETAKNAGICGIGAGWGFRGADELVEAGAAIVLESPKQLAGLTIPTE